MLWHTHTRNAFVYQIEYPHASDLSVLQVVVPARLLLSGLKQMGKKGMWRVLLQYSASLVPELWLFLIRSQVFNPSIVMSYQPAAVVVCYNSLPEDYYWCKDCNWTWCYITRLLKKKNSCPVYMFNPSFLHYHVSHQINHLSQVKKQQKKYTILYDP